MPYRTPVASARASATRRPRGVGDVLRRVAWRPLAVTVGCSAVALRDDPAGIVAVTVAWAAVALIGALVRP